MADQHWERPRASRPWRRFAPLAVVVAAAIAVVGSAGDPGDRLRVDRDAPTPPDDVVAPEGRRWVWRTLPEGPLVRRSGHSVVWTGAEVMVWGGERFDRPWAPYPQLSSGAAYDPVSDGWRRLSPAPIPARAGHASAWTGAELLIWGGESALPGPVGAAYDPVTDDWRVLPAGPLDEWSADAAGVWAGDRLIVYAHDGAQVRIGSYDPGTDAWGEGTPLSVPEGTRLEGSWVGGRLALLVVPPGGNGRLHRYRPDLDVWEVEGQSFPDPDGFVGAGDHVVVWGDATAFFRTQWGALVDARTGELRSLPGPPIRLAAEHVATAAGGRVLVWDGRRGAALDLATGAWARLGRGPLPARARPAGVWAGDGLFVWGGGSSEHHADGAWLSPSG